jgi:hypothetical protein
MAKTFENSDIACASWGNSELYSAYHAHTHTLFIEYFSDEHLALRFDSHLKSVYIFWRISNKESPKYPGIYHSHPMIAIRDIGDTPSDEKITIASFGYTILDKTCSFQTLLQLLEGRCEKEYFRFNLLRSAFPLLPGTLTGLHDWV